MRSASPPIGIAKSSQGSIPRAEIAEIETGAVVNLTAMSGIETRRTPSAKLLAIAADHRRLKADEKEDRKATKALYCRVILIPEP